MEAFTTTPELVGILMEYVCMFKKPRATLANCARVNCCFSKEAVRVLWRELPSLQPFLDLLPRDIRILLKDCHKDGKRVLINPSDWDKALSYAPFVRKLDYSSVDTRRLVGIRHLDSLITEAFQDAFPSRVFLPNLLVLVDVHLDSQRSLSLLSPSLQTLNITIDFKEPDSDTQLVIEAIQRMTSLDVLQWRSCSFNVTLYSDLGKLLDGKNRLRELSLDTGFVSWEQLHVLQSLSNLEKLSFSFRNTEIPTAGLASFRISLPRLRELSIVGDPYVIAQLIQVVQLRPREQVIITPTHSRSTRSYPMLFDAIGCLPIETLRKLEVCSDIRKGQVRTQGTVIHQDTLQPILKFSNLTRLVLQLEVPIDLCDGDIPGLLRASPNIRQIRIAGSMHRVGPISEPRLSPSCLLFFAREAPQLRYLAIRINKNWQGLKTILQQSFHSTSCLEMLDVGTSKLEIRGGDSYSVADVSTALARFFPRLTKLVFTGHTIASEDMNGHSCSFAWTLVRGKLGIDRPAERRRIMGYTRW